MAPAIRITTAFITNKNNPSVTTVIGMVSTMSNGFNVTFMSASTSARITAVRKLMNRYRDVPISLSDACLIRMAEQYGKSKVLTLDSDFRIYRKHERQIIPTIMPDKKA